MRMFLTRASTTLPNAPPMTTARASSIMFPFRANALNSAQSWRGFTPTSRAVRRSGATLDEGQPLAAEPQRVGEQVAPDLRRRRQGRQGATEGFDRQVAVVAGRLQAAEEAVPIDLARAGRAPVVLGDVDVDRLLGARGDRLGL